MKKSLQLTCLLLYASTGLYAAAPINHFNHAVSFHSVYQDVIKGTVKDETGATVPGVTIIIKGSKVGTQTNTSGQYSIAAKAGDVLVFSFIGYQNKEVTVGTQSTVDVTLGADSKNLETVVVTALGVKRSEKSLTYNTQQVSGDELSKVKSPNLMNSLNGKVAGLTISPSASGVGGSAKVILRGSRSVSGNNQPLYVIDGVPISNNGNANGQQNSVFGGGQDGGDGISNLNPDDIASITVLEGASAAALYGSQAQNGVILITTKQGKAGKTEIGFSSGVNIDNIAYKPKFQNSYGPASATTRDSWGSAINNTTDNLKDFFQTGINTSNAINLSGGSEIAQTYFSYSNTYASGIQPGNKLNRNNINLRETAKFLNNKLTVDASVNYINQKINNSPSLGLYLNPLVGLYLFPRGVDINPYKEQYLLAGNTGTARQNWLGGSADINQNPWWLTNLNPNTSIRNRFLLSGSVKYDVASWLNVQVRGNMDRTTDDYENHRSSGINGNFNSTGTGYFAQSNQTYVQKYVDAIANITVPLTGSDFKLNGLIGGSINDQKTSGLSLAGNLSAVDFFTPSNTIVAQPGTFTGNTLTNTTAIIPNHNQLQAVFGNANLSYKDWAFFTVTGRNDWSSNLSYTPNNSYFYPSFGLSFIVSQMFKLPEAISYAKVRGTYAEVGNTVPPYLTFIQNTLKADGALLFNTNRAFRELKPERTKSFEIGTDLRFLANRINFSFTYYKTNTRNQYIPVIAPPSSLVSTGYLNAGNVENKGIQFILGADVVKGDGFNWNTSINGSANRNKIIDIASEDRIFSVDLTGGGNNSYISRLKVGGSYGDIYGYTLQRDAQNRVILGGDGTSTSPYTPLKSADFNYIGNANPKFQLGWNNSFSYKDFSLSFLIDGKFGGQVLSLTEALMDEAGASEATGNARNQGGVKIDGVDTKGNAVSASINPQSYYSIVGGRSGVSGEYIYSATVVRLREAALGYTFPLTGKTFKSMKFSVTGRNLIYFYKKAPFDPEITMSTGNGLSGIDVFNQPATRTLGFNLNLSF
ncbi:SusC/RagA family TonB-linked outer membrane protein [Pedobacter petrophilus]|uniref:SusC/RagA family TonB-linked outer membrane protein n=1 Tax=Pedobacter petrophilus TaxID=1908241 RepID=A0A7K0G3M3_9SPHI|nr:SusC/RagA family TonB-linked outer membrane protein [Pedobacter petrophilus]MRX78407.1 SusC/RagA family TonB-linked outer membrane protein [Pedobacter petrophilus]